MPDASDPRGRGPADWGDAFAALPPETPPADGLARFVARLDARLDARGGGTSSAAASPTASVSVAAGAARARRPRRFRHARTAGWLGAATAAALAIVLAWPRHDANAPAVFPKPRESATPAVATVTATAPATAPATVAGAPQPAVETPLASARRKPAADATAIALPKAVQAARKPRLADTGKAAAPAQPDHGELDALYAESARLEALLALARDDRVSSAGAALLAAELDAQVAVIDAHLAEPALDDAQRTALWRARVDALRQAAGFESTQRVLAAQGDGGALLVSID